MLVLTRKHQEKIQIGENVTITILKVKGRTVRLGIEAPRQVKVVRGELPRMPGEDVGSSTVMTDRQPAPTRVAAPGSRSDGHPAADPKDGADSTVVAGADRENVPRSPLASLVKDVTRVGPMNAVAQ
jgi:carbon storage regulator CsrA